MKLSNEKKYYVYALYDPMKNDQIFYIGKGTDRRIKRHYSNATCNSISAASRRKTNLHLYNTIKCIFANGFTECHKILRNNLTELHALRLEKALIEVCGRRIDNTGPLLNINDGGAATYSWLGKKHSIESRLKMSKVQLGHKVSQETRQKLSIAHTGKKLSLATRQKMRESAHGNTYWLGKKLSEEHKRNMSMAQKGKEHTKETKEKMSIAQSGANHPMYGKHHTTETKEKLSRAGKGRIISKETRKKISEAHKGRKFSSETRKKISEAKKGKKQSPEVIRKREETKKRNRLAKAKEAKCQMSDTQTQK